MSLRVIHRLLAGVSVAALFSVAGATRAADEPAGEKASPPFAAMSEADISSVLVAANNGEIQQARLALQRSQNPAVRAFARRMLVEHRKANRDVRATLAALHATLTHNAISRQLEAEGMKQLQVLSRLSGPAFDRVYMDIQVKAHRQVLDLMSKRLVPEAMLPAFRNLLGRSRAMVERHLEFAQSVRASLG